MHFNQRSTEESHRAHWNTAQNKKEQWGTHCSVIITSWHPHSLKADITGGNIICPKPWALYLENNKNDKDCGPPMINIKRFVKNDDSLFLVTPLFAS